MKMTTAKWMAAVLVAGLLAFVGCGKSSSTGGSVDQVRMDFPKFKEAFPSPTPAQQSHIEKLGNAVRYRLYPDALDALGALDGDSSLTEPQKKAVAAMIEVIKKSMANSATPPAQ
jgi:hypothetical protein